MIVTVDGEMTSATASRENLVKMTKFPFYCKHDKPETLWAVNTETDRN